MKIIFNYQSLQGLGKLLGNSQVEGRDKHRDQEDSMVEVGSIWVDKWEEIPPGPFSYNKAVGSRVEG